MKPQQIFLILLVAAIVLSALPAYAIHQPVVEVQITSSLGSSVTVTCVPPPLPIPPAVLSSAPCTVSPSPPTPLVTYDSSPAATVTKNSDGSVITANFPSNIWLDNTFHVYGTPTSSQGQCVVLKNSSISSTTNTVNQVKVQSTSVRNAPFDHGGGYLSPPPTLEAGVTIECRATVGLPDASSVNDSGRAHGLSSTGSFYRKQKTTPSGSTTSTNTNILAGGDDHTAGASFAYFLSGKVGSVTCPGVSDPDPVGGFPSVCQGGRAIQSGSPGSASDSYAVPTFGGLLANTIANGINVLLIDHALCDQLRPELGICTVPARCVDFFGSNSTCLARERLTAKLVYHLAYPTRTTDLTVVTVDRVELTASGDSASGPPLDTTLLLKSDSIPGISWHGGAHQADSTGIDFIDVLTVTSDFDPSSIVCDIANDILPVLVATDPSHGAVATQCIPATDALGQPLMRIKFDAPAVTNAGAGCDQVPGVSAILLATANFKIAGTQVSSCQNNPKKTCTASFGDTVQTLGAGQLVIPINPCKK